MWEKIVNLIKSIFFGSEGGNQIITGSPNSMIINGDNNKVIKGQSIQVDEETETLIIKDSE